ncbi:hypothetical protein J6590_030960 [Homalodisca vitripennis]|nr:hypothetical protein J6590_030960 [Homalodisca vitripennis]
MEAHSCLGVKVLPFPRGVKYSLADLVPGSTFLSGSESIALPTRREVSLADLVPGSTFLSGSESIALPTRREVQLRRLGSWKQLLDSCLGVKVLPFPRGVKYSLGDLVHGSTFLSGSERCCLGVRVSSLETWFMGTFLSGSEILPFPRGVKSA